MLGWAARVLMESVLGDLISRAPTSLAVLVSVSPTKTIFSDDPLINGFPSWVSSKDRKLLQALPNEIKAKDGSGNYKTLGEAVATAPDKKQDQVNNLCEKDTYKENVEIEKKNAKSLMVVGCLNVMDGSTTFNLATIVAVGIGFTAHDIWLQNTAGPQKHQVVALRVGAHQLVINRCKIDAYQDTLYAHFIFG